MPNQSIALAQRHGAALVAVFASLIVVVSCSSGPAFSSTSTAGTEQNPCRAGKQCDDGLVCLSGLCVDNSGAGSGGGGTGSESGGPTGGGPDAGGVQAGGKQGAAGNLGAGGDLGTSGNPGTGGSPTGAAGASQDGGAGGSPPVDCVAAPPYSLVGPPRRACDAGACYCSFDACFPAATAAACCDRALICGDNAAGPQVDCSGKHPVIGPPRTCEPGFCLCSKAQIVDVCLPAKTAPYCCPSGVDLKCVPD